jgi:hypothetical protein
LVVVGAVLDEEVARSTLEERAEVGRRGVARSDDASWIFIVLYRMEVDL